jgi:hypothetical protein
MKTLSNIITHEWVSILWIGLFVTAAMVWTTSTS